jgi:S-adenosylmethionine:tRNA ribosyltransferase-isomerase
MSSVKDIQITDYDYQLPDSRIAKHPIAQRDACRLLVRRPDGERIHTRFSEISQYIPANALLVRNNTRVINARLRFRKTTGATIEIFLLEPASPVDYAEMFQATGSCVWNALIGNSKRWKGDDALEKTLVVEGQEVLLRAERIKCEGENRQVRLSWTPSDVPFATVVEGAGFIPIPPYLNRESEATDSTDYQTVYASLKGSVAAPTAGLHFTPEVFNALRDKGVDVADVTLHVGAGTFRPVKSDSIGEHDMHTETFVVSRTLVEKLIAALQEQRPVIAVGTTSVRTLETLPILGFQLMDGNEGLHVTQWEAYDRTGETVVALTALRDYILAHGDEKGEIVASTAIMIAPSFKWRVVKGMVTNFHQPKSTLLLLVSSFLQRNGAPANEWRELYADAMANDYRFLSYGDGSLLF